MNEWMDPDKIIELAQHYKALGPLIGLLLPFIESFLPFLPLFVFVLANAGAYGLWLGFILSWAGTVVVLMLFSLSSENTGVTVFFIF